MVKNLNMVIKYKNPSQLFTILSLIQIWQLKDTATVENYSWTKNIDEWHACWLVAMHTFRDAAVGQRQSLV